MPRFDNDSFPMPVPGSDNVSLGEGDEDYENMIVIANVPSKNVRAALRFILLTSGTYLSSKYITIQVDSCLLVH